MSNDGERLLAKSIERYYRSRAAVRSSGFLLFLCHARMDRGRMLLERVASRKDQPGKEELHAPARSDWPKPTPASGTPGSASTASCVWCCIRAGARRCGPWSGS